MNNIALLELLQRQEVFTKAKSEVVLLGTAVVCRIDGAGQPLPTIGRQPCGEQDIRLKMLRQNAFFHWSTARQPTSTCR
jgi:hypothetical protein